jgi:hypothetical protein
MFKIFNWSNLENFLFLYSKIIFVNSKYLQNLIHALYMMFCNIFLQINPIITDSSFILKFYNHI